MHADKLDEIDLTLLDILQTKGRTKRKVLAESVHLSIPSVSERLRRLEEHGYIQGYSAVLNPERMNLGLTAFIFITAESSSYYSGIISRAKELVEILECHAVTGSGSYLIKVRTRDTSTLEELLSRIQSWDGVKDTTTHVVLSSHKETTALPTEFYFAKPTLKY